MKSLSILIPAYNEAERLPRTFSLIKSSKEKGVFKSLPIAEIWVIDDGSTDATPRIAREASANLPEIRVDTVNPNQGKGNAIHTGLKRVQSEWCLIADADSATPWDQLERLLPACIQGDRVEAHIAMGSRDLPESHRNVHQSWLRENLGRLFNLAIRLLTGLPFKDTQCGFKLVHVPSIRPFLDQLEVKRFAWDVEFLMFAKRYDLRMQEVAVIWEHQEGSRIRPIRDGIEMVLRVIQLRIRMLFIPGNP
ncbi:MAG: glycosyltransferase family 2 protein [Proteobacteria bacterium]|nr:glycosyltransferase family 2 protein [Pseudomonadota bacterium]